MSAALQASETAPSLVLAELKAGAVVAGLSLGKGEIVGCPGEELAAGAATASPKGQGPGEAVDLGEVEGVNGPRPPLTNRGSVRPEGGEEGGKTQVEGGVYFHVDWLRLTVWLGVEEVKAILSALLDHLSIPALWSLLDKETRWKEVWRCPAAFLEVDVPRDASKGSAGEFVCISIPGKGCSVLGDAAIGSLVRHFDRLGIRWHVTRIDLTWDHCGFTPEEVFAAGRSGNIRSRLAGVKTVDWKQNEEGNTAALGERGGCFYLRCYDKRGYTRLEAELQSDWAKEFGRQVLAVLDVSEWRAQALSWLRRGVDFVDRSVSERSTRCPYLPWWSAFVGDAEKAKMLPQGKASDAAERSVYQEAWDASRRCLRPFAALVQAFGWEWVKKQVEAAANDPDVKEKAERWAPARGIASLCLNEWDGGLNDAAPDLIPF